MVKNRFGLDRDEGADVRRVLREEAGFGCLICGLAIGDYHHIDPQFADAKTHEPSRMAFLCNQCHTKVHRGFLSNDAVWEAKTNPCARRQGFSWETFDFPPGTVTVHLGTMHFVDCDNIIMIEGNPVLSIRAPSENGGPLLISAKLVDVDGTVRMWIDENVWKANVDNWDVTAAGGKIVIRDAPGRIRIAVSNRNRELNFERLNIGSNGHHLHFDKKSGFTMNTAWGERLVFGRTSIEKCKAGILLEGPILALGADARQGAKVGIDITAINKNYTHDQMREIFQAKIKRYGVDYMTAPSLGGRRPSTYRSAQFEVR